MPRDHEIGREEVSALLASALGQEKSDEVISGAAHELGLPSGGGWSGADVRALFDRLSTAEGLVGVVARFAVSRGDVDRLAAKARPEASEPRIAAARRSGPTVDLLALLAPALGAEKARDATEAVAARMGVDARALSREDALRVLDALTATEGIVGVVARFAKARFLLSSDV